MINDYRRGWEDALDVVLELRDWDAIKGIHDRLYAQRIDYCSQGPIEI